MRGIVPHMCAAGRARLGGGLGTGARLGGGFRAAAAFFSRCRSRAAFSRCRSRAAFSRCRSRACRSRARRTRSGTWPLPRVVRFGAGAAACTVVRFGAGAAACTAGRARMILRSRAARRIAAGTRVLDVLLRLVGARVSSCCRCERVCRFRPSPEALATCLSQPAIRTGSSGGSAVTPGTTIEARRLLEPCEKQANAAPLALAAARQTRTQSTLAQQDLGQENQPEVETEASGVLSVTAVP